MAQELKIWQGGLSWREFYEKSEVDAVLAEKDAEIERLKDKCQMHDFFWEGCGFAKRGFKNAIAVSEAFDDLEAENIRLRKRLFRMCARLGKMGYLAFLNVKAKLTMFGDGEGVAMASMKKNQWRNVERKCRAKAESYL